MLGFFPEFYPDELVYSLLARYYVRTGYMVYRSISEELFEKNTIFAEIEFIQKLKPEVIEIITKNTTMEDLVMNHTMFPYYGRFISKERKDRAFQSLINMEGNYQYLLPISKNKKGIKKYLRYCPICSAIDRNEKGETYWHRIHQMTGVNVCPIHGCLLCDSDIEINKQSSSSLICAEEIVPVNTKAYYPENQIEYEVAKYVLGVFHSKMDMESVISTGQFLHSKMEYTKYVSPRGQQRKIKVLMNDLNDCYKELEENSFKDLHKLRSIFQNKRHNTYEICLLCFFLQVSVDDIERITLPEKTQVQEFDERVKELHSKGLNYREIATLLNAPYDVVKPVGENVYGKYKCKKNIRKQEYVVRKKNWSKEDDETLPRVYEIIKRLQGDDFNRPRKITVYSVSKELGISREHIRNNLSKCRAVIEQYMEFQERYWAREVVWATKKIKRENDELSWSRLANSTNTRKQNLISCIPYLKEFCEEELEKQIVEVIQR